MNDIDLDPVSILVNQINGLFEATVAILPELAVAIIIVCLTWFIAKIVKSVVSKVLRSSGMRRSLQGLLRMLAGLAVWLIGLMAAAVVVFPNLTPSSIIAGLGIGSVAIGFAFKDTFENFLAGIIILMRKEMRIEDHIECQDLEGQVEDISIRETHIRRTDGQLVIVPNSILFKNPLTIRTDLEQRRTTIVCGIAYSEDVAKGRDTIRQAVESCSTVAKKGRAVEIFAQEFADSSINFEITWWTGSSPLDIRKSRDEVVEAVKDHLDRAGIEIPFPYRTLTFNDPVPVAKD